MRKLHELMEIGLKIYNPFYNYSPQYMCYCLEIARREMTISNDECNTIHSYIRDIVDISLCYKLFNEDGPECCTEQQQIQMVMFWINEIEILKEKNL